MPRRNPNQSKRKDSAQRAARKLARLQKLARKLGVPFAHEPEPVTTHGRNHPAPFHRL